MTPEHMEIIEGLCVEHRLDIAYDSHVLSDAVPIPFVGYMRLRKEACMNEEALGCTFERKTQSMDITNGLRFHGTPLSPREFL